MLSNLPIARSAGARAFFFASVIVTLAIMLWIPHVGSHGLTASFFVLFARLDRLAALCMLLILLIAAFTSARSLATLPGWVGKHTVTIAVGTGIVLCAGSMLIYENHPLSMDEYAQLFQSEVFAHGRLTGQFPVPLLDWLVPSFFQNQFLVVARPTGTLISGYWPSFALLLTPFTLQRLVFRRRHRRRFALRSEHIVCGQHDQRHRAVAALWVRERRLADAQLIHGRRSGRESCRIGIAAS